jgi:hypothetical protein
MCLQAQSILGWSPIEFDATLETRIMPVFEGNGEPTAYWSVLRLDFLSYSLSTAYIYTSTLHHTTLHNITSHDITLYYVTHWYVVLHVAFVAVYSVYDDIAIQQSCWHRTFVRSIDCDTLSAE